MFTCEFREMFKNTCFEDHLQTAASRFNNRWSDKGRRGRKLMYNGTYSKVPSCWSVILRKENFFTDGFQRFSLLVLRIDIDLVSMNSIGTFNE